MDTFKREFVAALEKLLVLGLRWVLAHVFKLDADDPPKANKQASK